MDSAIEKSCLEEISTNVFDSLQKVTLKTISNSWQVSNAVAKDVLNKWLKLNEKKLKEIVKEYVIQGINVKGTFSISVVPEDKKEKLEKKWKSFDSWLYSVETKSNSKSLDLPPTFEPIHVKNVQINLGNRDLQIAVKQEAPASQINTTKIKTPFGMVKPLDKKEIKKEKVDEIIKEEEKTEKVKIIDPSKEELPPKISPESKPSSSKPNAKKNGKSQSASQGKGSISSFFSKQASNKGSTIDKPATTSEVSTSKVKEEPEIKVEKEEVKRKRSASPAKQKNEPPKKVTNKKMKLKDPPNKKRTRIQVMEDSSEEEEEEPQVEEQPDSKFIKFDREMTPEKPIRSPVKDVDEEMKEPEKEETQKGHKNKAKRWVTKRFETDDGFIRTEKVLEEYSASEDENDENRKKNSPPQEKKTPQKKVTPKTKVKDMPVTKQGSIMNFFSKK